MSTVTDSSDCISSTAGERLSPDALWEMQPVAAKITRPECTACPNSNLSEVVRFARDQWATGRTSEFNLNCQPVMRITQTRICYSVQFSNRTGHLERHLQLAWNLFGALTSGRRNVEALDMVKLATTQSCRRIEYCLTPLASVTGGSVH